MEGYKVCDNVAKIAIAETQQPGGCIDVPSAIILTINSSSYISHKSHYYSHSLAAYFSPTFNSPNCLTLLFALKFSISRFRPHESLYAWKVTKFATTSQRLLSQKRSNQEVASTFPRAIILTINSFSYISHKIVLLFLFSRHLLLAHIQFAQFLYASSRSLILIFPFSAITNPYKHGRLQNSRQCREDCYRENAATRRLH